MQLFEGQRKIKIFLIFFLMASVMAIMNTTIVVSSELAERYYELTSADWVKVIYPLTDEFTGAYTFCLLIPALLAFFIKFPLQKDNLGKRIPLYLLASIVFGLSHTAMMYISRSIVYPALNLGNYDYGYIPFRIVMEYIKQFMGFGTVFAIFTIFKINKEKEAHRLKTTQLEQQLTRARLETLKMQLNPHFLFNTLNMISSTMYDDLNAADKMIANLSDLLRITLKTSAKGENRLDKEIEILNLYIEIMKARFKDKLQVEIDAEQSTLKTLVPNFIFQPLVENSIKYGMENLSGTKVNINVKKEEENIVIKIEDNGPGITKNISEVFTGGVGLSNTAERLEKLYGDDYEFNWENRHEGGLLINIRIPFKLEKGEK